MSYEILDEDELYDHKMDILYDKSKELEFLDRETGSYDKQVVLAEFDFDGALSGTCKWYLRLTADRFNSRDAIREMESSINALSEYEIKDYKPEVLLHKSYMLYITIDTVVEESFDFEYYEEEYLKDPFVGSSYWHEELDIPTEFAHVGEEGADVDTLGRVLDYVASGNFLNSTNTPRTKEILTFAAAKHLKYGLDGDMEWLASAWMLLQDDTVELISSAGLKWKVYKNNTTKVFDMLDHSECARAMDLFNLNTAKKSRAMRVNRIL